MQSIDLAESLTQFGTTLAAGNVTRHTMTAYVNDVRQFLAWVEETSGAATPQDVTRRDVIGYLAYLGRELGLTGATRGRKLASIRTYFKQLQLEDAIGKSPAADVLAAYSPCGSQPALTWGLERGSILSAQFVDFVQRLPGKPLVVVIDNGSLHKSWVVKEALATLRAQRIYLYYLPPYSPKLNDIEGIFGVIKRNELPERRHTTWESLEDAIIAGFTHVEERLLKKCSTQPRLAA